MGFWAAVQWWEEWQLRILALTSLFIQCFLSMAAILCKSCIPSWLRFLIWLAYLGSDAVAIYGLATLFNRQRTQEWVSTHERSARLQVLWAPILLIHLGGQDGITAYNIEDNELWRRHVLTAVSQAAVAVYVFRNSWPEDKIIFAGGVLLFVVGILKCVLKPWDLKRVNINSLVDSSAGSEQNPNVSSHDEYIRAATENFREGHGDQQSGTDDQCDDEDNMWKPYDLFADLSPPYSRRLSSLKAMVHNPDKAHGLVRYGLSMTFDILYTTKSLLYYTNPPIRIAEVVGVPVVRIRVGVRVSVTATCLVIVLVGFRWSHKEAYDHTDVKITLTLLCLAFALDYLSRPVISAIQKIIGKFDIGRWPDLVAQYNLMGYLVRNEKHRKLRRLATLLVCKDYIDQLWCMKPSKSSRELTKLVYGYIAKGWTEHHIKDMATYRAFNDNRDQWTLNQEGCNRSLDWGLRRTFNESVLICHLATDFCFLHMDPSPAHEAAYEAARCSKDISNYMAYLLFVNPEMVMTGARRSVFRAVYKGLKGILLYDDEPAPQGEKELAQNIIHRLMGTDGSDDMDRMVHDAWAIVNKLIISLNSDEENIWRVVQGVWVEMLCFSAGRCRGYLHAKSLGKGGEFLSYVWLLLFYVGMETVVEKMQRSCETKQTRMVQSSTQDRPHKVTVTA